MPLLAFCIGSNDNAIANIRGALDSLQNKFGPLRCSNVYRSAAVGFDGDDFLNLVALAESDEPVPQVVAWLKNLEVQLGRDRAQPQFSSRPIDIDLLTPDAPDHAHGTLTVSHHEVLISAFILRPLAELLPNRTLGPAGPSFAESWANANKSQQPLTQVEFNWPESLSPPETPP